MCQNYTIFIQDNLLELIYSKDQQDLLKITENNDAPYLLQTKNIYELIEKLKAKKRRHFKLFFNDLAPIIQNIVALFDKHLVAAGGLVFNPNQEILFIYRKGFWDLPKGKLEAGETSAQAALREVEEETCVQNLILEEALPATFHTYIENGKWILKESHWFKMSIQNFQTPVPQVEEGITEVKWVDSNNFGFFLQRSYPNIKDLFSKINIKQLLKDL